MLKTPSSPRIARSHSAHISSMHMRDSVLSVAAARKGCMISVPPIMDRGSNTPAHNNRSIVCSIGREAFSELVQMAQHAHIAATWSARIEVNHNDRAREPRKSWQSCATSKAEMSFGTE